MAVNPTVLVVDDDHDTRELYSVILSLSGWTVLAAGTVGDGIRLAARQRPAVVVCDWLLSDGRGGELCRGIRRAPGMRRTPIIAVTGLMMTAPFRAEARQAGVYTILEKPVLPDRVAEVVQEAFEWRRARQLRAAAVRVCRTAGALLRGSYRSGMGKPGLFTEAGVVAQAANQAVENVAIMLADDGGQYVAANATAAALTGYPLDDLLSLSVWDLTPGPKSTQGREMWNRFIATGCQEGKYTLRRNDGRYVAAQYCAIANVAPGLHLSALIKAPSHGLRMRAAL